MILFYSSCEKKWFCFIPVVRRNDSVLFQLCEEMVCSIPVVRRNVSALSMNGSVIFQFSEEIAKFCSSSEKIWRCFILVLRRNGSVCFASVLRRNGSVLFQL